MATARIKLPELFVNQARKEIIHNEALWRLDALVPKVVDSRTAPPPASPQEGNVQIVPPGTGGAWTDHDNEIAYYYNEMWSFISPIEGMMVYVLDEGIFVKFNGTDWEPVTFTAAAAGSTGALQYNQGSVLGGAEEFVYSNGNLECSGRILFKVASISSNYTSNGERFLFVDSSAGAVTITLSDNDKLPGNQITVKDIGGNAGANNITITPESGQVDGSTDIVITTNYGSITIVSDGNNWFQVA